MAESRTVAVVTGASSGIGAVYADRLALRGYDLMLVARRQDRLGALADRLRATHHVEVETFAADLTVPAELDTVAERIRKDASIAVVVNNAGNGQLGASADMPVSDVAATIALNVTALTRLTMASLPGFLARNSGAIINISSAVALQALPIASLYGGTKSFVLAFSQGLQQELEGSGVQLQVVLPAGVATEFYDHSGIPLSAFDPAAIMSVEDLVDAALAGFDRGEKVTLPSVEDVALWSKFKESGSTLFAATQNGQPASRYLP